MKKPVIGLALGSGSARGWAHIGIINAMEKRGIHPEVVCGSSIGALVGAAYVSGNLGSLEKWCRGLTWRSILQLMDITLNAGGFIEGKRLMDALEQHIDNQDIPRLGKKYAAVATDLATGREEWLQEGNLFDAVRASIALPGLFTPVRHGNRWLVDGGLVNPVPVSLCRALGAEIVIAVDLNGDIVGRHLAPQVRRDDNGSVSTDQTNLLDLLLTRLPEGLRQQLVQLGNKHPENEMPTPGLFEVVASSINIMQDRITRSRMAGDPPNITLSPRLARIDLLAFDRADEAITEGEQCVERMIPALRVAVPWLAKQLD